MAERLLQLLGPEGNTETTSMLTPDHSDTLDTFASSVSLTDADTVDFSGGWSTGMNVTHAVTLEKLIAKGGMGSVWVADHTRLKKKVAVKLVAPALLKKHPSLVERIDREAAALGRLDSPHVVEIYDYGTTSDGTPYMVMELLNGVTLWGVVKRHGAMSLSEVSTLLEQLAGALTAAHGLGIVHRDVKPQNIFLFARDDAINVKLIDFGIAKELAINEIDSVTKTGTLVGTPHFMSPEQLLKPKEVDTRTDLWSLGVVAYFSLTRKFPFDGETLASLFANITGGKFPLPSTHGAHIPKAIDDWVVKALANAPTDRFRTAREQSVAFRRVVRALDAATAGHRTRRMPSTVDEDDEDTYVAPERTPPVIAAPTPPPVRAAPANPVDTPEPKNRLLPYPFALLQDGGAPEEGDEPAMSFRDGPEDPQRKLILLGAVLVAIVLIAVLVTR